MRRVAVFWASVTMLAACSVVPSGAGSVRAGTREVRELVAAGLQGVCVLVDSDVHCNPDAGSNGRDGLRTVTRFSDVVDIAANEEVFCLLRTSGKVHCTGHPFDAGSFEADEPTLRVEGAFGLRALRHHRQAATTWLGTGQSTTTIVVLDTLRGQFAHSVHLESDGRSMRSRQRRPDFERTFSDVPFRRMDSLRSEAWIDGETLRVGLHHVDGPGLTVVSGPDLHMPRTDSNRFGCVVSGERTILCRDPQTLGRPGLPDPDTCEVRIVQPTLRWTASERVVGLAARVFSRDEPACWQLESGGVECASGAAHPGFERDVTPVPEQFGRLPSGVLCSLYTDGSVMCRDPSTQQVRVLTL